MKKSLYCVKFRVASWYAGIPSFWFSVILLQEKERKEKEKEKKRMKVT